MSTNGAVMNPPDESPNQAIASIGRDPALTLHLIGEHACPEERASAEAFIRERFADRYGARVRQFMPTLIQLVDGAGVRQAAVGVRSAGAGKLFLERYLDGPVEAEIGRGHGLVPDRDRIAEVGNLAARGAGHARLLIVALTALLVAEGYDWVVFTGTPEVLNSFRRLELRPVALGAADPVRMGEELPDWGSYYETRPTVMAGSVRSGHERLVGMGMYQRLAYHPRFSASGESCVAVA